MDWALGYTSCRPQKQSPEVFYTKKVFLKVFQNPQENTGKASNLKLPALSCQFYETFEGPLSGLR